MAENETTTAPHPNWGRWGADDERGALNLIDDACTLAATKLCKTGKMYSLSLPIQRSGVPAVAYRGPAQRLTLMNYSDEAMLHRDFSTAPGVGAAEDVLVLPSHSVTHIDALSHVYAENSLYNGHSPEGVAAYEGASRCGIETVVGVATRGVLIDVAGYKQVDWLAPDHIITPEDIDATLEWQGTELRSGDVVMIRTGWVEWFMGKREMDMAQPGIGLDAAIHLGDQDVAIIGADNTSVEAMPFDRGVMLGAHIELLVKRGVFMIEHLKLDELAADRCYESLFTMGPMLVTGASGCPVNPIAIG